MADDLLRMQASVTDRASGPLRAIARELGLVGKSADFAALRSGLAGVQGAVGGVGREIRSIALPALGALGLTSAGIAASLYGVARALRSVAESTLDLGHLSRQTGFAAAEIRGFSQAAAQMRIAPEAANAAIGTLSSNMFALRRNLAEGMHVQLRQHGAGDLVEQLRGARTNYEALNLVVERGEKIRRAQGEEAARRFFALTLGNADMARLTTKQIKDLVDEQRKHNHETDAARQRAYEFHLQTLRLDDTLRRLKRTIGIELMPALTPMIGELDKFIQQNEGKISGGVAEAVEAIARVVKATDWNTVGAGLLALLKGIALAGEGIGYTVKAIKALDDLMRAREGFAEPAVPEGLRGRRFEQFTRIKEKQGQISQLERQMEQQDKESVAYRRMAEKRDALVRELKNLEEGFRVLERAINDAADKAKKMNFFPTGGGAPIVVPASLTSGGGGGGGGGFGAGRGGGRFNIFGGGGGGGFGAGGGEGPGAGPVPRGGGRAPGGGGGGGGGATPPPGPGATPPRGWQERIAQTKSAMMDQLRREGVPEGNLEEAANLLTGQAIAESRLNPRAVHDQGTGYGIYGARDPTPGRGRKTGMLNWLKQHGYPTDSLEGQSRYMAHEAMSGRYGATRRALMSADPRTRAQATNTITREFEAPKYINPRAGHVSEAAGVRSRIDQSLRQQTMPNLNATGRLTVDVNAPRGTKVQAEGGGLFRNVEMNRSMQMTPSAEGPPEGSNPAAW